MQLPEKVCFRRKGFAECLDAFSRTYHLLVSQAKSPSRMGMIELVNALPKVQYACDIDVSDIKPLVDSAYSSFLVGNVENAKLSLVRALAKMRDGLALAKY